MIKKSLLVLGAWLLSFMRAFPTNEDYKRALFVTILQFFARHEAPGNRIPGATGAVVLARRALPQKLASPWRQFSESFQVLLLNQSSGQSWW